MALFEEVIDDVGYALGVVQLGGMPPSAKAWKGIGPGVFEIVQPWIGNTYRALFTVRFSKAVYVLHVFQKKSPSGKRTARPDVQLIASRLTAAEEHYEAQYGKD